MKRPTRSKTRYIINKAKTVINQIQRSHLSRTDDVSDEQLYHERMKIYDAYIPNNIENPSINPVNLVKKYRNFRKSVNARTVACDTNSQEYNLNKRKRSKSFSRAKSRKLSIASRFTSITDVITQKDMKRNSKVRVFYSRIPTNKYYSMSIKDLEDHIAECDETAQTRSIRMKRAKCTLELAFKLESEKILAYHLNKKTGKSENKYFFLYKTV